MQFNNICFWFVGAPYETILLNLGTRHHWLLYGAPWFLTILANSVHITDSSSVCLSLCFYACLPHTHFFPQYFRLNMSRGIWLLLHEICKSCKNHIIRNGDLRICDLQEAHDICNKFCGLIEFILLNPMMWLYLGKIDVTCFCSWLEILMIFPGGR